MERAIFRFVSAAFIFHVSTCLAVDWIGPELHLTHFVDPLPIPNKIKILSNAGELELVASQFTHSFHRDLPQAQVWGFNRSLPGPTLEVQKGKEVRVYWTNHLPNQALFKVSGLMPTVRGLPEGRMVVHLHGGVVPGYDSAHREINSDGWPDAWIVSGAKQLAVYPNQQNAAGLWYHDHTSGITAQNVYAGLAGAYVVRDDFEKSLNLPSEKYEIPLIIQSRSFNFDGSLYYPPQVTTEFYGNTTTVNGKIWPFLIVEPRKYRFRILNASNARTYALKLQNRKYEAGPVFTQIGSDGGFLSQPVILNDPQDPKTKRLILAPGERADVIVDFSEFENKELILNNNAKTNVENLEPPIPDVMMFRVSARRKIDHEAQVKLDRNLFFEQKIVRWKSSESVRSRKIILSEVDYPDGTQMLHFNNRLWDDPIEEKPVLNTIEEWNIVNATEDMHPFHMHLVQFQLVGRQEFDVEKFQKTGQVIPIGPWLEPDPNEMGWKDTIKIPAGEITRLTIRFGPFLGRFVYHCHILEHEDMDMMRPFEVVKDSSETDPIAGINFKLNWKLDWSRLWSFLSYYSF